MFWYCIFEEVAVVVSRCGKCCTTWDNQGTICVWWFLCRHRKSQTKGHKPTPRICKHHKWGMAQSLWVYVSRKTSRTFLGWTRSHRLYWYVCSSMLHVRCLLKLGCIRRLGLHHVISCKRIQSCTQEHIPTFVKYHELSSRKHNACKHFALATLSHVHGASQRKSSYAIST